MAFLELMVAYVIISMIVRRVKRFINKKKTDALLKINKQYNGYGDKISNATANIKKTVKKNIYARHGKEI